MMLVHIGLNETATLIHNAWLKTIEDGVHTYDIARGGPSVGTKEFAQAVVDRLGEKPRQLKAVDYGPSRTDGKPLARQPMPLTLSRSYRPKRELNGVDVYLYNTELSPSELGRRLEELAGPEFSLTVISNRGVKVYPDGFPETFLSDHWRCRFEAVQPGKATRADIVALLGRLDEAGFEWIKLDNLYLFDGQRAYSLDQGQ